MGKDNVMSYHIHWKFATDGQSRKVTCAIAKRKTLSIDTQMNSNIFKYPALLAFITMETGKQRVNFWTAS